MAIPLGKKTPVLIPLRKATTAIILSKAVPPNNKEYPFLTERSIVSRTTCFSISLGDVLEIIERSKSVNNCPV